MQDEFVRRCQELSCFLPLEERWVKSSCRISGLSSQNLSVGILNHFQIQMKVFN
jgi:hypothetical protein